MTSKVKIAIRNLMEASYITTMAGIASRCFVNGSNVIHIFEISQEQYDTLMRDYNKSILPSLYLNMKKIKKTISCEHEKIR